MPSSPARKPRRSRKLIASERWYDENASRHAQGAETISNLLRTVLQAAGIDVHDIRKRVKAKESFLRKAARPKYKEPWREVQDVVGVRVITYFESAARAASIVVESEFEIDRENSLDKSESLGTDRVGYRSFHYIARLSPQRCTLPEYASLEGLQFEIQVRSVLQHAWAEIEHDRRFKNEEALPDHISRRFSVLAGVLELADREFDAIGRDLDSYATHLKEAATRAHSSRPLEIVDLAQYLASLFGNHLRTGQVEQGFGGGGGAEALHELQAFGVATLGDLVALVPPNFEAAHPEEFEDQTTFGGILRRAMIAKDGRRYFERSFSNSWSVIDDAAIELLASQGLGPEELRTKYGVVSNADLDECEECAFCGSPVPAEELQAIGAGGQDAPMMCASCMSANDEDVEREE